MMVDQCGKHLYLKKKIYISKKETPTDIVSSTTSVALSTTSIASRTTVVASSKANIESSTAKVASDKHHRHKWTDTLEKSGASDWFYGNALNPAGQQVQESLCASCQTIDFISVT